MTGELAPWWTVIAGSACMWWAVRGGRVAPLVALYAWSVLLLSIAPASYVVGTRAIAIAAVGLTVLALAGAAAWWTRNRTHVVAAALGACATLRLPLDIDGETVRVLAPLYAVLVVAVLVPVVTTDPWSDTGPLRASLRTRWWATLPSVLVVWAGLAAHWSIDAGRTSETLALLFVPGLIACTWLVNAVTPTGGDGSAQSPRTLIVWAAAGFLVVQAIAACTAIVQRLAGVTWQNPKLQIANELGAYFRPNAMYWDPNMLARLLVVALVIVGCMVLVRPSASQRRRRAVIACAALLSTALLLTHSQSGMAAIFSGTALCLALLLGSWKGRTVLVGILVVPVLIGSALIASGAIDDDGRSELVRGGARLVDEQPIAGTGAGTFEAAYGRQYASDHRGHLPALRASHTSPVTVVVELGVVGIAVLILLLGTYAWRTLGVIRGGSETLRADPANADFATLVALIALVSLASVVAHSLLYGALLEAPETWLLLAACASAPLLAQRANRT